MLWFRTKKYEIWVKDAALEQEIRKRTYHYIFDLILNMGANKGLKYAQELMDSGKISPNFLKVLMDLHNLEDGNALYRGIDPRQYKTFLRYGNSKALNNISEHEAETLRFLRINDPSQVMYADRSLEKAWEFTRNHNPAIIVIYDGRAFEKVEGKWFLYRIRDREEFKNAVRAYVVTYFH